ncbi:hypothetical protein D3874_19370 [Oleomonas cavernae]|uniref:Long-chain fatty acid transporter n=1 Tax=Oleomonas cavernae TaxID=2320859 RepID=A0A418WG27_9PROT|nr:outer membrane protein transport protein [Oleomonas cavernae]RJF88869.1 hypothetical protein D3874_19370 [Oleomonas cavernae]
MAVGSGGNAGCNPVRWAVGIGLLCLAGSCPAGAASGLLLDGVGGKEKGMAGAGLALPQDGVAVINNPATSGLVRSQISFGGTALFASPEADVSGAGSGLFPQEPGTADGDERWFGIPYMAAVQDFDSRWSGGLSIYGFFGLGAIFADVPRTNCPLALGPAASGPLCAGESRIDFSALLVAPSVAYALTPSWSIGVAPVLAYSRIELRGLGGFAAGSIDPSAVSDNGVDEAWGFGGEIGLHYQGPSLSFGLTYQTRMDMRPFDRYRGLLADGGKVDLPSVFAAGIAADISENLIGLLDIKHVRYSNSALLSNRFVLPGPPGNALLGSPDGAGFGWKDQTTFHLGLQYYWRADTVLRAGYAYSTRLFPDSQVSLSAIAPGTMTHHVALGGSYFLNELVSIDLGATYTPATHVRGRNAASPDQTISEALETLEIGLGFNYRW